LPGGHDPLPAAPGARHGAPRAGSVAASGVRARRRMMRCEQVEALSGDYVDGRLAARAARAVAAHLNGCAACRSLVEDFRRNKGLLAHNAPRAAEPEFGNRALAHAREAAPAARQRLGLQTLLQWQRGAAWATAAASLAVGVLFPVRFQEWQRAGAKN